MIGATSNGTMDPTLHDFLTRCGVPAGRLEEPDGMERLYADLVAANRETNLTRIVDETDFWIRHVSDSLAVGLAAPDLLSEPLHVADVGPGGGFPLLVLGWANRRLSLLGAEPRKRKAAFLEAESQRLGLENVAVVARQAREVGRMVDYAGRFDRVTLRAVGEAGKMVREVRQLLKPGGRIVFYKTPDTVHRELPLARREAEKFGFRIELSEPIELPIVWARRQFLVLVKE